MFKKIISTILITFVFAIAYSTLSYAQDKQDNSVGLKSVTPITKTFEDGVNSYTGTRDNTIYQESENSNGGGYYFYAGRTNFGNIRRALIAFDISEIPQGSTVTSVSLELTVNKTTSGANTQTLHFLTKDWGEGTTLPIGEEGPGTLPAAGDATWHYNFYQTSSWTNAGGDYAAQPSASADVGDSGITYVWSSSQMAADVQKWVDGTAPNYGWILIGDESKSSTSKRYYSADNTIDIDKKLPRLTVTYTSTQQLDVKLWYLY